MIFLGRHLKDLEPEKFQQLCFHILKAKYPQANIEYVDGAGGDKGLDLFRGDLSDGPVIWQCKCFNGKVHSAQKRQVKRSLLAALNNFKPKRWILCLSANLTATGHAWFQDLQKEYAIQVRIELFQASDIEHELICRRSILDVFFPALHLNPSKIKALTAKTDELTTAQVGDVAGENVDQLKRRLEEKDARYTHKITFPQEGWPPALELIERTPEPDQVMSVYDGMKIIDFYARDPKALELDPPKFRMRFQEADVPERIDQVIKRGSREEFGPVEILEFPSPVAELLPSDSMQDWRVIVGPPPVTHATVVLRTTFGTPPTQVVYEAIEYAIKRLGTEEIEIESVDTDLPFVLSMILRLHGPFTMNLRARWEHKDIRAVHKWLTALGVIRTGGNLELYDIKREGRLALASIPASPNAILGWSEPIVKDLLELSDRYGIAVRVPRTLTPEDRENLRFALQAARSGWVVQENVERISFNLNRNEALTPQDFAVCALDTSFAMVFPNGGMRLGIGDNEVDLGPYTIYCRKAVLADFDQAKENLLHAKAGEPVRMVLELRGPLELCFHRFVPPAPKASS